MERFFDVTFQFNVQLSRDCSLHSKTFLSTVITPSLSGPLKPSWNLQQKILVLLFEVLNTLNTFYEVHYDLQSHFIITKILFSCDDYHMPFKTYTLAHHLVARLICNTWRNEWWVEMGWGPVKSIVCHRLGQGSWRVIRHGDLQCANQRAFSRKNLGK